MPRGGQHLGEDVVEAVERRRDVVHPERVGRRFLVGVSQFGRGEGGDYGWFDLPLFKARRQSGLVCPAVLIPSATAAPQAIVAVMMAMAATIDTGPGDGG